MGKLRALRDPGSAGVRRATRFNRNAGNRFNRWFTGSTSMPVDSRAVTPSRGSVPSSPMMTRPAVKSPMNSMYARTKSILISRPSAVSYTRCPSGSRPIASMQDRGTSESVAPVSTRNRPSQLLDGSAGLRMVTVTWVVPMALSFSVPSRFSSEQIARE